MAQESNAVTAKAVMIRDRIVSTLVDANAGHLPAMIRQVSQLLVSIRGLAVSGLPYLLRGEMLLGRLDSTRQCYVSFWFVVKKAKAHITSRVGGPTLFSLRLAVTVATRRCLLLATPEPTRTRAAAGVVESTLPFCTQVRHRPCS